MNSVGLAVESLCIASLFLHIDVTCSIITHIWLLVYSFVNNDNSARYSSYEIRINDRDSHFSLLCRLPLGGCTKLISWSLRLPSQTENVMTCMRVALALFVYVSFVVFMRGRIHVRMLEWTNAYNI